jgi:hypothetical protein
LLIHVSRFSREIARLLRSKQLFYLTSTSRKDAKMYVQLSNSGAKGLWAPDSPMSTRISKAGEDKGATWK